MTEENTAIVADDSAAGADAPARDYETEARAQGWVPEAEWKGDKKPAQFLDAETFVKRGEEITPFVRKENQRLKDELARERADAAKRFERLERTTNSAFETLKRQHEAELGRIKTAQRAAVAAGDEAEFDRLDKARSDLEKAAPVAPEKVEPEADLKTRQDKWRAENKWFDSDFEVQDWAIRFSDFHGRQNPHLSFEENMAVVTAEARKKFPEKFGGARQAGNGHSAVDAGGDFSAAFKSKGKKTAADLPAEAKAAGEKFVRDKLYKNLDEYAKDYFND